MIIATHSNWGGYHHVEVHDDNYWIAKMTMFGFVYEPTLTGQLRATALSEKFTDVAPNGIKLNAQHVHTSAMVFINPAVAALPQHAHLMAEPGCFIPRKGNESKHRECGENLELVQFKSESVLPKAFRALELTAAQDLAWFEHVKPKVVPRPPDEEYNAMMGKPKQ